MAIKYQPLFLNADLTLHGCALCGALVRDTEQHTRWHRDLQQQLSRSPGSRPT